MENNLNLVSPWTNLWRQIEAMFEKDPEIRIQHDEYAADGVYNIRLYVDNTDKANALSELLPNEVEFGAVTAHITVIPKNMEKLSKGELLEIALRNNPVLSRIEMVRGLMSNPITYVAFRNEVVQYPADNLHDIDGNVSTLYENIANDIFGESDGICFCTDSLYHGGHAGYTVGYRSKI